MGIYHRGMQRRIDEGTYIPQSSKNPATISIEQGYCYVGHFSPTLRNFKNPDIIPFGSPTLREFVQAKAGIILRISEDELLMDSARIPTHFQGKKLAVIDAVKYLLNNASWATGILVADHASASDLIDQYETTSTI